MQAYNSIFPAEILASELSALINSAIVGVNTSIVKVPSGWQIVDSKGNPIYRPTFNIKSEAIPLLDTGLSPASHAGVTPAGSTKYLDLSNPTQPEFKVPMSVTDKDGIHTLKTQSVKLLNIMEKNYKLRGVNTTAPVSSTEMKFFQLFNPYNMLGLLFGLPDAALNGKKQGLSAINVEKKLYSMVRMIFWCRTQCWDGEDGAKIQTDPYYRMIRYAIAVMGAEIVQYLPGENRWHYLATWLSAAMRGVIGMDTNLGMKLGIKLGASQYNWSVGNTVERFSDMEFNYPVTQLVHEGATGHVTTSFTSHGTHAKNAKKMKLLAGDSMQSTFKLFNQKIASTPFFTTTASHSLYKGTSWGNTGTVIPPTEADQSMVEDELVAQIVEEKFDNLVGAAKKLPDVDAELAAILTPKQDELSAASAVNLGTGPVDIDWVQNYLIDDILILEPGEKITVPAFGSNLPPLTMTMKHPVKINTVWKAPYTPYGVKVPLSQDYVVMALRLRNETNTMIGVYHPNSKKPLSFDKPKCEYVLYTVPATGDHWALIKMTRKDAITRNLAVAA